VIATMGHIRALEQDLDAVGLARDFEPRYEFLKEKSKAIASIKAAAAEADQVYLASDDDREGEAISYSVAVLLKLNPATAKRAVFHEITEKAVKAAVANPRLIDMNRVNAQQARAVLDMMVGFTISPLLWKYVGPSLSAGRCQTPALRLLADRETEIKEFSAETTWRVKGTWSSGPSALPFTADMIEDLEDQESATNYLENLHDDSGGTVKEAETKPFREAPPKPLITSTLQQEASALYGSQPKNTMKIAQRLYEAGHITYMRTDHAILSEEAKTEFEAYVRKSFGDGYVAVASTAPNTKAPAKAKKKIVQTSEPNAQEAHEAIRPTHVETVELPTDEDWNATDRKIYRLVWQRAVQSIMAAAEGEARTVLLTANGDPGEFQWRATWRRQTFAGWRKIGAAATNLDEDSGSEDESKSPWALATSLEVGTALQWSSIEAAPHTTKAPGRYTEATLVRELERQGIGRPSTFAALVGTILEKAYAEKTNVPAKEITVPRLCLTKPNMWPPLSDPLKKKIAAETQKLVPTPLGLSALEFCLREFGDLFNYEFTAQMESRLDAVAKGITQWKEICRDTWNSYKAKYESLKAGQGTAAAGPAKQRLFAGGIKAVQSKKGPLLLKEGATKEDAAVFYGWPPGKAFGEITEAEVAAFVAEKNAATAGSSLGEHEGHPLVKKVGPYGTYVEWNGSKVPWKDGDTAATIIERLESKTAAALHTLGPFEFRKGPYGVYMFKKDLTGKARKFVGLPSGVDPKSLTQEAAVKIYQTGLTQKAKGAAFSKKRQG
jgi:DNA topoisomerase-1